MISSGNHPYYSSLYLIYMVSYTRGSVGGMENDSLYVNNPRQMPTLLVLVGQFFEAFSETQSIFFFCLNLLSLK